MKRWHLVLIVFLTFTAQLNAQDSVSYKVDFTSSYETGGTAEIQFSAWIPDNVNRIRGLYLSLPGSGGSHENIVNTPIWQFRMAQMGWGIVGFRDASTAGFYWGADANEVNQNLDLMQDLIADSFDRPEIRNAPILLDGISQGGFFAGYVGSIAPERTVGYIGDKGYGNIDYDPTKSHAPGYVIAGAGDDVVDPIGMRDSFLQGRQLGGNVAYQLEWNKGHVETSEEVRLTFMDQAIRARYPQGELPSLTPGQPLQLNERSGYLAESAAFNSEGMPIYDPDIIATPESEYPLDPLTASWLPTKTMARAYLSHNHDSIIPSKLELTAPRFSLPTVPIELSINGVPWTKLKLFHNETLLEVFDPSDPTLEFDYIANKSGLHTFYAEAEYEQNGERMYATDYLTITVINTVIPEPNTLLLAFCGALLAQSASRRNRK